MLQQKIDSMFDGERIRTRDDWEAEKNERLILEEALGFRSFAIETQHGVKMIALQTEHGGVMIVEDKSTGGFSLVFADQTANEFRSMKAPASKLAPLGARMRQEAGLRGSFAEAQAAVCLRGEMKQAAAAGRDYLSDGLAYAGSKWGQYFQERKERFEAKREQPARGAIAEQRQEDKRSARIARLAQIPDGTFTIEYADGRPHRTLHIETQAADASFAPGKRIVGYLEGSDNENDFRSFAFLNGEWLNFWKTFSAKHSSELLDSLTEAIEILAGDPKKAGLAYALASSRCFRCNRTLTVPASIHSGLGPECAKRVGW